MAESLDQIFLLVKDLVDFAAIEKGKLRLEKIKVEIDLAVGDKVEIVDGPLNGMIGTVTEVNTEMGTASLLVEMFGRETVVDVELAQVRKVNN